MSKEDKRVLGIDLVQDTQDLVSSILKIISHHMLQAG